MEFPWKRINLSFSKIFRLAILCFLTYKLYREVRRFLASRKLKQQGIQKNAQIEAAYQMIKPQLTASRFSTAKKQKISYSTISDLQRLLKSKEISVVDLISISIERAHNLGRKYGWLSDQNYCNALSLARKCDRERKQAEQNGVSLSPLHGIPFTVKDHIRMKGTSSTWGRLGLLYPLDDVTSATIRHLIREGAIPIAKGSTPCSPSVITWSWRLGYAKNPYDLTRSAGGSSGGQAGFVGSGCVPFGIGSDIAGSVRFPCSWCGLVGLSPTADRTVMAENVGLMTSRHSFHSKDPQGSLGPIARSVQDIETVMKTLCNCDSFKANPLQIPLPYGQMPPAKNLKIGYYETDKYVTPCKAQRRAVQEAVGILKSEGFQVCQYQPPDIHRFMKIFFRGLCVDQGKNFVEGMALGQTLSSSLRAQKVYSMLPRCSLPLVKFLIQSILGEKRIYPSIEHNGSEIIELQLETQEYLNLLKSSLEDFDALVLPVSNVVAPKLESFPGQTGVAVNYTMLYKYLDCPTGSVPVTNVLEEEQHEPVQKNDSFDRERLKIMENSAGLPVGVQVVGLPYHEEVVVLMMKIIENHRDFIRKNLQ